MPAPDLIVCHTIAYYDDISLFGEPTERNSIHVYSSPDTEQAWDQFEFRYREILEVQEAENGPLFFNPRRCNNLSPGCGYINCLGCEYEN